MNYAPSFRGSLPAVTRGSGWAVFASSARPWRLHTLHFLCLTFIERNLHHSMAQPTILEPKLLPETAKQEVQEGLSRDLESRAPRAMAME